MKLQYEQEIEDRLFALGRVGCSTVMATPGFYAAIKTGTMKRSYHAGVNRVGVSDRPNELWQKEARDVE